ncbi:MAG TPA: prepilin-type N-terminal cleavage/methylation domain-containing protein [Rugosimonospora sp.]|nr:prepilin-type N-terminal cleavage/methylation domain-containing protein [Rugosimonospora sp.]
MEGKLRHLRERRADGDRGFTLIELLVVVVIIGILVAIAVPLYLNYRKGAENRSAQSDMRNAITAVEQCYTEIGNAYPASKTSTAGPTTLTLTCSPGTDQTVNISSGNTLTYTLGAGTPASYTVAVKNSDTGKTYTYTSSNGQVVIS